ncbi:rhodanese-like domain-containing protein [Nioella sp. MMSF_3534]|uniref:rhodanese-like domain-containing protein n=1 Tax=Nioella sp. MMSF_3534 TaxID=3046720 RepID=UPI00273DEA0B|nr:rhodanese-like domain-containing protein [Nioella sp. MMSF_3534]
MTIRPLRLALCLALISGTPALAQQDAAIEAMQDYLMFAEETAGIILPQQIDQTVFDNALFVDTRSAAQHAEATIPGAVHIEWREVLDRIDEIPETRMTILFCNTGARSSQATFALRVAGRTNVVVLQSGFEGWLQDAAYHP